MRKTIQFCCKIFCENYIKKCFAANLASNSYVKFAMDSIAAKLLAKLNNKITNLDLGYLQNFLWIVLVTDFAANFICGFSCRNKTCI